MTLSVSNVSTNEKTTLVRKIHNPKAQAPAVYIPAWLIQIPNSKLPYSCKLVYGRLAQWASCEGIAFRSVPQLAIELGMPKRTVDSSIQKLKAVGLIGTYQTRNGGSNHYEFYDHDWMYQPIDRNLCYQSDHISPHADIALPHAKMAVHINNNKYNNNIISDLDEKSGFMSNCNDEYLGALETAEFTGNNLKSDYQNNQTLNVLDDYFTAPLSRYKSCLYLPLFIIYRLQPDLVKGSSLHQRELSPMQSWKQSIGFKCR